MRLWRYFYRNQKKIIKLYTTLVFLLHTHQYNPYTYLYINKNMKNILANFRLEQIKTDLIHISNRFPVSVSVSILVTLLFLYIVHLWSINDDTTIVKVILSLIVTFFLSVWSTLYSESEWFKNKKKYLLQLFPLIFWICFFFWFSPDLNNIENVVFFFLSLAWIIWFLFFAPYTKKLLKNKWNKNIYYSYFYRIATVFLKAIVLGWVLFILGMIWIQSVIALFDLNFSSMDKVLWDWATVSLALFAPLFALTQLPTDFKTKQYSENSFSSFLIKYVATPFICIYFLILYAYSLKVLLNFSDWPKWEVTWLVIGFSVFGYIIYIFSYAHEKNQKLIKTFRKYFPYAVVPQVAMLFYAIYLRISQYDLTINRYFVVVFWLWLLLISLYFVFSKKKYLWYIPAVLTLFTILISVGPWSVYNLPEVRQVSRLKSKLAQANIMQNGSTSKASKDIDPKLSGEIYDGINYICKLKDCSSIKEIFSSEYEQFLTEYKENFDTNNSIPVELIRVGDEVIPKREYRDPNTWEIVRWITEKIWVERYYEANQSEDRYYNFSIEYGKSEHFPISVVWYDTLIRINQNWLGEKSKTYVNINLLEKTLSVILDWEKVETINITSIFDSLEALSASESRENLTSDEMTFDIVGEKIDWKLFLENISFYKDQTETEAYRWYTSWYMLLK